MAKVIRVILTTERVGRGLESDPVRFIHQLWTLDGRLICAYDGHGDKPNFCTIAVCGADQEARDA